MREFSGEGKKGQSRLVRFTRKEEKLVLAALGGSKRKKETDQGALSDIYRGEGRGYDILEGKSLIRGKIG